MKQAGFGSVGLEVVDLKKQKNNCTNLYIQSVSRPLFQPSTYVDLLKPKNSAMLGILGATTVGKINWNSQPIYNAVLVARLTGRSSNIFVMVSSPILVHSTRITR